MLQGKVAIVTGGSRGIGRAIVLELAAQGADVAVVYAGRAELAEEVCRQAQALGRCAKAYRCDVGSFAETKALAAQVLQDFGRLDILVNNAGITQDALLLAMSEESFDAVLTTNLKGAFNMTKQVYSTFMRQRSGRIINITSISGIMGNAGQANYSAAKAGMIGLTKSVAKELASRGVTCNAVAPGFIETEMTADLPERVKQAALEQIPQKAMGCPEDVAALVAFLAGDRAKYITGEVIQVDGGLAM